MPENKVQFASYRSNEVKTIWVRQQVYDYLTQRPNGATSSELLRLFFSPEAHAIIAPGRSPDIGVRILNAALGADPHFAYDSSGDRWYITTQATLLQSTTQSAFIIVDLETTGLKPGKAGITEIAAIRLDNGRISAEFHSLVNPGRRIPTAITRLTGITNEMVRDQPSIDTVLPQFLSFLGSTVVVAHNAAFDLSFLNFEAHRLFAAPLLNSSLCTLLLARRLLPELRSRSLDALASHLGIAEFDRHRALGDARIAAEVLLVLLEKAEQIGIHSLGELIDFQHSARDGRRFEFFIPRSVLTNLPDSPGVYRMLNGDRQLLYVGKAKNLRRRISSYFTNSSGHSDKILDLVRNVRDISYEQTGSELEAALREAMLIRDLKPPYNTLSKHLPRVAFLKLTRTNPYPRLTIASKPGVDRSFYIGPFRSREFAEKAQRLLARLFGLRTCHGNLTPDRDLTPCLTGQIGACSAPCNASIGQETYASQIAAFLRFLDGEDASLQESLTEKRNQLASELRFEGAARIQQDLQLLDQILHTHDRLRWIVTRAHAFLLLPSRESGAAQAYLVLNGRLATSGLIRSRTDLLPFITFARDHFTLHQDQPLRPEEIDVSVILAAWLRGPDRTRGAVFTLDGPMTLEDRIEELDLVLQDLHRIEDVL